MSTSPGIPSSGALSTDQLDETEIGNTGITTPYNLAEGRAGGIEATVDAVITQKLTAFGNVSLGLAQGKGADRQRRRELPRRAHAGLGAGRVRQRAPDRLQQRGPRAGWVRVDLTLVHDLLNLPLSPTLAIDVVNLFDSSYAYRLYNGFNGSHWAPGRSVYVRASVNF